MLLGIHNHLYNHKAKKRKYFFTILPFSKNKVLFDKKAAQILCLEQASIVDRQGANEEQKFVAKPT